MSAQLCSPRLSTSRAVPAARSSTSNAVRAPLHSLLFTARLGERAGTEDATFEDLDVPPNCLLIPQGCFYPVLCVCVCVCVCRSVPRLSVLIEGSICVDRRQHVRIRKDGRQAGKMQDMVERKMQASTWRRKNQASTCKHRRRKRGQRHLLHVVNATAEQAHCGDSVDVIRI